MAKFNVVAHPDEAKPDVMHQADSSLWCLPHFGWPILRIEHKSTWHASCLIPVENISNIK
jgi:hypothetical protein